jgi:hypothetical protein
MPKIVKNPNTVTPVEVAHTMPSHKDTKAAKENPEAIEAAKSKKEAVVKKPSRKDILEQRGIDLAKMAEATPAQSEQALKTYQEFFQLDSLEDFVGMIQDLHEETDTIILKNGMELPISLTPTSDLSIFLNMHNMIMSPSGKSPIINIVNYANANPEMEPHDKMFTYILHQFLAFGRKTPLLDLRAVEATPCAVAVDDWAGALALLDRLIEDPENTQEEFKGFLNSLAPDTVNAMSEIFSRDSFKKQGVGFNSPAEGDNRVYDSVIADSVAYVMFDLWGEQLPALEEGEDEEAEGGDEEENYVELGAVVAEEPDSKFVEEDDIEIED